MPEYLVHLRDGRTFRINANSAEEARLRVRGHAGATSKIVRTMRSGRETERGRSDVKIVHNKVLGGWYVVRGPHHTPLNGRFNSRADAQAWLDRDRP